MKRRDKPPRHAVYTSPPVSRGDPGVVRLYVWAALLLILVIDECCLFYSSRHPFLCFDYASVTLIIFVNPRHVSPAHLLYIGAPTFIQFCSLPPNSAIIGCTTPYFCPQSANTVSAHQKVWQLLINTVKAACHQSVQKKEGCGRPVLGHG